MVKEWNAGISKSRNQRIIYVNRKRGLTGLIHYMPLHLIPNYSEVFLCDRKRREIESLLLEFISKV